MHKRKHKAEVKTLNITSASICFLIWDWICKNMRRTIYLKFVLKMINHGLIIIWWEKKVQISESEASVPLSRVTDRLDRSMNKLIFSIKTKQNLGLIYDWDRERGPSNITAQIWQVNTHTHTHTPSVALIECKCLRWRSRSADNGRDWGQGESKRGGGSAAASGNEIYDPELSLHPPQPPLLS